MREARLALLASFGVSAIFSAHYLAAKVILGELPASALAAMRGLFGGLVLVIMFRHSVRRHLTRRHLPLLVAVAGLGFWLNQLLLFAGLSRTTPADAALISSLIPVIATLLAIMFGIDRPEPRRILGILIGLAVVIGYILHLHAINLSLHGTGNLLVLANVTSFCTALLITKRYLHDVPPEVVAAMMLILGGLGLWATGGNLGLAIEYACARPANLALIIFEVLVTTAVAYSMNLWALKRLSVATTTVFNYLQPVLTALFSWLLFAQTPSLALAAAFVGIVIACLIVISADRPNLT